MREIGSWLIGDPVNGVKRLIGEELINHFPPEADGPSAQTN